ncbi:RlmE family RNA methyltransferase [Acetobacteraceae bacterium]|nr:RlmE family RNA methyltransferase [Acetobacteraceae bacterium]
MILWSFPVVRAPTVKLKKARGRTNSQQRWLNRQLNDPYVSAAHEEGWRSRAAFKLIEMNKKNRIIPVGGNVVDLGAAPGGWSQVALKEKAGKVIGVDLLPVDKIPGAEIIQGDFTDPDMPDKLRTLLNGGADAVISDMAPNTTGHAKTDHIRIMALAELALFFAEEILNPGGNFVAKVLQGGSESELLNKLKKNFKTVKHVKPPASRKDSREMYVVALGYRRQE